jgi:hypothetical protein
MPCAFSLRPASFASLIPCSAGEQVLQIPFALAVTDEHEKTFGHLRSFI